MKNYIYILLIIFYVPLNSNSQHSQQVDSLQKVLFNIEDKKSDEAIICANEMLEIAVELDSIDDICLAYDWLAYIHGKREEFSKAFKFADSMLYYSRKMDKFNLIYNAYELKLELSNLQQEYEKALLYCDTLLILAKMNNTDYYFYYTYGWRAEIYIDLNKYEKASHLADLTLKFATKTTKPNYIGYSYYLKMRIAYNEGYIDEVVVLGKEMLEVLRNNDSEYYARLAFDWIIDIYINKQQYDEALKYAKEMLLWEEKQNVVDEIFYDYTLIIRLYELIPEYNGALSATNEMFSWLKKNEYLDTIRQNYNWQIYEDHIFRKDKDILDYYLEKIALDIEMGNQKYLANDYFLVGTIYMNLRSSKQALLYFDLAEDIYEEYGDIDGLAGVNHHKGIVYFDQKRFKEAIKYHKKCFNLYEEVGDINNMAISSSNIGSAYEEMKDDRSIEYLEKALKFAQVYKSKDILCLVNSCLGDYYLWKKEYDIAYGFLMKSIKLSEENNYVNYLSTNLLSFSELYEGLGDYEKAFQYHVRYKELNDSLFDEETTSRAMQFEIQHEYSEGRKVQSIKLLQKEKQIKINRLVLLLTFLILIFASVIIYYLYRNKIKQDKLKLEKLKLEKKFLLHELEYKEKELSTKIGHLVHKNDLISNITEELINWKERFKKENQRPVEEIIKELQFNVNKEIWEEFELRFKQVHTGFYKNLSTNFPSLTSNELKLCAFIKLNMSTKDISSITNQTVNSIEVARTRLRKKLNLANRDTNLIDFLAQF